jgi:hypothetical protein
MKIRLLLALVGLAISFGLPTLAQQKDTPDPQLRQALLAVNPQPRYGSRSTLGIHKRYCNLSRTVWENAGKTERLLPRSFLLFMRNLKSSPRGQRDECLEFEEYVARSYELRNKIAARVGARQPTNFGFVGRRTRSAGQIIWRSSGSR